MLTWHIFLVTRGRYIDNLHKVEAAPWKLVIPQAQLKGRSAKLVQAAHELAECDLIADEMAKIIKLWRADKDGRGGIVLLDEVDLLLHPLKVRDLPLSPPPVLTFAHPL